MDAKDIPAHVIDHHKQGVEQLKFYGVPAINLDRDGLLALANCLAQSLKQEREQSLARWEFMSDLES